MDWTAGGMAEWRQSEWQKELQPMMEPADQSVCGLCNFNQGCPKTRGVCGAEIMRNVICSRWLPETKRVNMGVCWVMWVKTLPSWATAGMGLVKLSKLHPNRLATSRSQRLSLAPESMRSCNGRTICPKVIEAVIRRQGRSARQSPQIYWWATSFGVWSRLQSHVQICHNTGTHQLSSGKDILQVI